MTAQRRDLADWAIRKIESEFRDDVCLLTEYRTLWLDTDKDLASFSCYVPATSRAGALARTFIINGIGYDLFPISWERYERFAEVKEYNSTCLADARILWARSENDRKRFESLQARLFANLKNPHLMQQRALDWIATAVESHREMLFDDRLYKVREHAGRVCNVLSLAVACMNLRYLPHGQTGQIRELRGMEKVPQGFTELYERIVRARTADEQKRLCHDMIVLTKAFAAADDPDMRPKKGQPDFQELADWYQELSYTWRRVYHFCKANEPVHAYVWCCFLQEEVDALGMEFDIAERDILSAFDADDLPALRRRAERIEQVFVDAIQASGVAIDAYSTVEEFLKENG